MGRVNGEVPGQKGVVAQRKGGDSKKKRWLKEKMVAQRRSGGSKKKRWFKGKVVTQR